MLSEDEASVLREANTLPGMTATSLYPHEARAAGIEFHDLLAGLINRHTNEAHSECDGTAHQHTAG